MGKDRVRIFGKSSVDIRLLIKSAVDIDVTKLSSSDLFIYAPHCYKRHLRFGKLSSTFLELKDEIKKTLIKVAYELSIYERTQWQRKVSMRKKLQHTSHGDSLSSERWCGKIVEVSCHPAR